ncbi:MAG: hypothetical protein JSU93_07160 [Methanobacteriota archaeon]|nr:MAG: hypothetical protein JSU93_07160 [Euryarchaeota archaeon]
MSRITAVLVLLAIICAAILALEWLGVIASIIALIGLAALVILILVAVAVSVIVLLSIPYFFITKKMEVKDGSFTLDRLEEDE